MFSTVAFIPIGEISALLERRLREVHPIRPNARERFPQVSKEDVIMAWCITHIKDLHLLALLPTRWDELTRALSLEIIGGDFSLVQKFYADSNLIVGPQINSAYVDPCIIGRVSSSLCLKFLTDKNRRIGPNPT